MSVETASREYEEDLPALGASEHTRPSAETVGIREKRGYLLIKRIFDIAFSILAIVVLLIPVMVVALAIVIDNPGASPLFVQERVGKNGKRFKFIKLRSMVPHAEEQLGELLDQNEVQGPAFKMKDDPRITRVGKFIRKTSIDELPQFINVLIGDMSVVGPRPPLPREVEQYTPYQRQRLSVTPGLTCYWQVQPNRNDMDFDEWLEWDLKYIRERSLRLDARLILQTVGAVLKMQGI